MASLADSNPYLRDSEQRHTMVTENTFNSSVFEGASPRSVTKRVLHLVARRRSKASAKKQVKGS